MRIYPLPFLAPLSSSQRSPCANAGMHRRVMDFACFSVKKKSAFHPFHDAPLRFVHTMQHTTCPSANQRGPPRDNHDLKRPRQRQNAGIHPLRAGDNHDRLRDVQCAVAKQPATARYISYGERILQIVRSKQHRMSTPGYSVNKPEL